MSSRDARAAAAAGSSLGARAVVRLRESGRAELEAGAYAAADVLFSVAKAIVCGLHHRGRLAELPEEPALLEYLDERALHALLPGPADTKEQRRRAVDTIRATAGELAPLVPPLPSFEAGAEVEIVHGRWAGRRGRALEQIGSPDFYKVEIADHGRTVREIVRAWHLRATAPHSARKASRGTREDARRWEKSAAAKDAAARAAQKRAERAAEPEIRAEYEAQAAAESAEAERFRGYARAYAEPAEPAAGPEIVPDCCGKPRRWDASAEGVTVGGLKVSGWWLCDICGSGLLGDGSRGTDRHWPYPHRPSRKSPCPDCGAGAVPGHNWKGQRCETCGGVPGAATRTPHASGHAHEDADVPPEPAHESAGGTGPAKTRRAQRCGRCGTPGHKSRTCKADQPEAAAPESAEGPGVPLAQHRPTPKSPCPDCGAKQRASYRHKGSVCGTCGGSPRRAPTVPEPPADTPADVESPKERPDAAAPTTPRVDSAEPAKAAPRRRNRQAEAAPALLPDVLKRQAGDFNRTDPRAVWALLARWWGDRPPPASWLDLGAGDGQIAAVLAQAWPDALGFAVERDPGRAKLCRERFAGSPVEVVEADYRSDAMPLAEVAIFNPPFKDPGEVGNDADAAVRAALTKAPRIAALLRVQWGEGKGRRDLVQLADGIWWLGRLAFRGTSDSDRWAYAWFTYDLGAKAEPAEPVPNFWLDLPERGDLVDPKLVHARGKWRETACGRAAGGMRLANPGEAITCLGCQTAPLRQQLGLFGKGGAP